MVSSLVLCLSEFNWFLRSDHEICSWRVPPILDASLVLVDPLSPLDEARSDR